MQTMTVSEYITKQLTIWGVKQIYGVAGDAIFPWLDVLGKQQDIRLITTRHESAAAMMASAEAKLTHQVAVCIGTSGPGTVNLLNGLADAHMDRVPVVAITGQVDTKWIGSYYKQYLQQQEIVAPISHYSAEVVNPDQIGEVLQRAFVTSKERKGVSHISICKDVLAKSTELSLSAQLPRCARHIQPDRVEVSGALEAIKQARKPLVLLGSGARQAQSWLLPFAERLGAGILLSLGAKGCVPDGHPLVLGGIGEGGSKAAIQALTEADTLIILGATWFPKSFIPQHLSLIQVDENPEAIHPGSNLHSVIANLQDVLPIWLRKLQISQHNHHFEWQSRIKRLHEEYFQETELRSINATQVGIKPEQLIRIIQQSVEHDAIIAVDTGEHTIWFNRMFRAENQLPIFSGKWRTMGYGLPAGIAAKIVHPNRQVVVLVGDGGLQMNLAELMTLKQYARGVTVIVANNHILGLEAVKMQAEGFTPFGLELENPDFALLAKACGLNSYKVESVDQLQQKLALALQSGETTILDVFCANPTLEPRKKDFILQMKA
ncbi:thiamine pyrophosphate-binding protein [Brevibacillus ginsengisoli]|uniref:thiamine pyrophosphate-binding protein n=1 Tax=Brevibacillus ginsengisoli TaxID=363854 RepID=UPI003CF55181